MYYKWLNVSYICCKTLIKVYISLIKLNGIQWCVKDRVFQGQNIKYANVECQL